MPFTDGGAGSVSNLVLAPPISSDGGAQTSSQILMSIWVGKSAHGVVIQVLGCSPHSHTFLELSVWLGAGLSTSQSTWMFSPSVSWSEKVFAHSPCTCHVCPEFWVHQLEHLNAWQRFAHKSAIQVHRAQLSADHEGQSGCAIEANSSNHH